MCKELRQCDKLLERLVTEWFSTNLKFEKNFFRNSSKCENVKAEKNKKVKAISLRFLETIW